MGVYASSERVAELEKRVEELEGKVEILLPDFSPPDTKQEDKFNERIEKV